MKPTCLARIFLVTAIGWLAAACGERRHASPPAEPAQAPAAVPAVPAVPPEFYEMLVALMEDGEFDQARVLLENTMTGMPDGPEKSDLFIHYIELLLQQDMLAEAQARYLDALLTDPVCAVHAHGAIEYYIEHDEETLLHWAQRVLQAGPPPDLRAAYVRLELRALQKGERFDELIARLDTHVAEMEAGTLGPLVMTLAQQLVGAGRLDEADRLRQWLAAAGRRQEDYRRMAALLRVDLLIARQQWDDLPVAAQRALQMLGEREAATRFERWCRALVRAEEYAVADVIAEQTMAQHKRFPAAAARAARWRVMILREQGDLDGMLQRFENIALGDILPPRNLSPLISWVAGVVFSEGSPEQARLFLVLSDKLPWQDMGEEERGRHIGMLMDISFNAADFTRTESLLKEGLPGFDERWHEVMLNKVHAHQAQAAGRTDEAVRRFRLFMQQIAADEHEDLVDPVTGHRVTNSMIQALNARRIGDILKKAGRAAEAAAAYVEAAGHYQQAIQELGENSQEAQWIRERLEEMEAVEDVQ